jgi:hypothetical protein
MWQEVQLKVGIYGVNFGYNVKMGVYANSSLDIPKLCEMDIVSWIGKFKYGEF